MVTKTGMKVSGLLEVMATAKFERSHLKQFLKWRGGGGDVEIVAVCKMCQLVSRHPLTDI